MVSFIDTNMVAYSQMGAIRQTQVENELKYGLPNVKLVESPGYNVDEKVSDVGFSNFCGIHVNALTTKVYIYLCTQFGSDTKSITIIQCLTSLEQICKSQRS